MGIREKKERARERGGRERIKRAHSILSLNARYIYDIVSQ